MIQWETENIEKELSLLKKSSHYAVIDIETTGLSPKKGGRMIEIAAVRVVNGQITDTFHTLIDPQLKIPPKITGLTGIKNEDVQGKPTIFEVLPKLYQFIGDAIVVCHNAAFDWTRFLLDGFQQVGIYPKNEVFCTLKFFKKVAPGRGKGGYTLDKLCDLLQVQLEHHHQAMDDTVSTAKCLINFLQLFAPESLNSLEPQPLEETYVEHTPVQVKQVRYWEKRKNQREIYRRQYVRLSTGKEWGSVYFDIPTQVWGNKDFPLPLDFKKVEQSVLRFLGLDSRIDLINFRN